MKKRNKVVLMEMEKQYHGEFEVKEYDDLIEFLEYLYVEGVIDEIEQDAYDNIKYFGKCSNEEHTYVLDTIKMWDENEYFRRLNEMSIY